MANNNADFTKLSDNFKSYLNNLNKKEEEKKLSSSSENAPKIPDGVSANFRKYLEDMQSGKTAQAETPKITAIERQDLITGKKMPSTFDVAKNAGRIPAISDENAMWNKFAAPKLEENAKKDAETYLKTGSVTQRNNMPEEYPLMVEQNVKKLAAQDFVKAVQNVKDSQKPANISREAAKYNEKNAAKNAAEQLVYERKMDNAASIENAARLENEAAQKLQETEKKISDINEELSALYAQRESYNERLNNPDPNKSAEQYNPSLTEERIAQTERELEQAQAVKKYWENTSKRRENAFRISYDAYVRNAKNNPDKTDYTPSESGKEIVDLVNGNKKAGTYFGTYTPKEGELDLLKPGNFGYGINPSYNNYDYIPQMTSDEVKAYNYVYNTEGADKANAYLEAIKPILTARYRKSVQKDMSEFATEHPAGASAVSLATNFIGGIDSSRATLEYLFNKATGKYVPLDQNDPKYAMSYATSDIRGTVADNMAQKGSFGEVGSFLYQTGMSMLDNVINIALTGGYGKAIAGQSTSLTKNLSLALMGSQAAANGLISAKDRGLSDAQAFALGTISGATEIITEKIPLDKLLDKLPAGKTAVAKYIGENILSEGLEEGSSDVINFVADIAISKDKSEWNTAVNKYMTEDKLTKSEAVKKAFLDQVTEIGLDTLGGMISGGTMSAFMSLANRIANRNYYTHLKIGEKDAAVNSALYVDYGSENGISLDNATKFTVGVADALGIKNPEKAFRAAVDYTREEIISLTKDSELVRKDTFMDGNEKTDIGINLDSETDYVKTVNDFIRNNQNDIKKRLSEIYAERNPKKAAKTAAKTETTQNTAEITEADNTKINNSALTENRASATINAENTQSNETKTAPANKSLAYTALSNKLGITNDVTTEKMTDAVFERFGDVRSAVDFVFDTFKELDRNGDLDGESRKFFEDIDKNIRNTAERVNQAQMNSLKRAAQTFGANVEWDNANNLSILAKDEESGGRRYSFARFDRSTNTIYLSPYASRQSVIGGKFIHEFTHFAGKYDGSVVSDILSAMNRAVDAGKISSDAVNKINSFVSENYQSEISAYLNSEECKARISEITSEQNTDERTAADIAAKEYADEERAAYFMETLMQDDSVLRYLADDKKGRNILINIFEKIKSFIKKLLNLGRRDEAVAYAEAGNKIRAILNEKLDAELKMKIVDFTKAQSEITADNAKIGNTADGRRFSMELNVDESNGLFAIHNLTSDNFMKSYKLGGFAMPSIAIARGDVGHSNFGDISLVFDSNTIDPEMNRANKVYSADAWTPTFPRTEYEANSKVAGKLRDKYYELYRKFGQEKVSALYPYGNYFEEQLNTDGGVDGIISKQSNNPQMMQVYLADTQGKTVDSVVKETKTTLPAEQLEQSEFIIDKLGTDTVNEMRPQNNESPISARKRWMSEHGDAFKAAYADYLTQSGLTSEEAQNAIDNMTVMQLSSQVLKARNYLANGAETVKSEVDTEATNNAIKEAVNQEDYLKWLHSLFDGGEKKSGIPNGKDPYTRNGDSRPFSATHYPVTLDNIVLSMKSQGDGNTKNATSIFVGSKTIRAESSVEYSSLDEIRADKGRLAHRTAEEAKAMWDEFDNRLSAIINRIMDAESGIDNRFIEMDRIGSVLAEASRNNTEANIEKVLTQYKLTPAVAAEFKALVDDIKSAPVDIFEAKPERVVGLDEVKYAIVPSNVDADVKSALKEAGIETKTYEKDNNADRLKVLNTLSDVRFSKELDTDTHSEITQADIEQLRISQNGENVNTFDKNNSDNFSKEYALEERNKYDERSRKKGQRILSSGQNIRSTGFSDRGSRIYSVQGSLGMVEETNEEARRIKSEDISADTIGSNEQTAEQRRLAEQNKLDLGLDTKFFRTSKINGKSNTEIALTDTTLYVPLSDENSDFVVKSGKASFTEKRLEDLISEYSVNSSSKAMENYSKGYVAYISPSDFLSLTTRNENHITDEARRKYASLDLDVLSESQPIFLRVDFSSGEVEGHEGRHRMALLRDAGINSVAIALINTDTRESAKYNTKKINSLNLSGQVFNGEKSPGNVTLNEVIPLSPKYRTEVFEKFSGDNDSDIQYSKDFMTEEQRRELKDADRRKYLERQLVQTDPLGRNARAVAPTVVSRIAKDIAENMPGVTTSQVYEKLKGVFDVIEHPKSATVSEFNEEIRSAAEKAATELYNSWKVDNTNPLYDEYSGIYKEISTTPIFVSDEVKKDFDNYGDFFRENFGKLKFRSDKNSAQGVDSVYARLYGQSALLFGDDNGEMIYNPADQLRKIAEVRNSLAKTPGHPASNPNSMIDTKTESGIISDLTNTILASYIDNSKLTVAARNKALETKNKALEKQVGESKAKELEATKTLNYLKRWQDAELNKTRIDFERNIKAVERELSRSERKIERINDSLAKQSRTKLRYTTLQKINRLLNLATNPTKTKYMPESYRKTVFDFLVTIGDVELPNGKNISTAERAKLENIINKANALQNELNKTENNQPIPNRSAILVDNLDIIKSVISDLAEEQNKIEKDVRKTRDNIRRSETAVNVNKTQYDGYLEAVNRVASALIHDINYQNKLFIGEKIESAEETQRKLIDDLSLKSSKFVPTGVKESFVKLREALNYYKYNFCSPSVFFSLIGDSGTEIEKAYREAQTKQTDKLKTYSDFMKEAVKDYDINSGTADNKKNVIGIELQGKKFDVTRNQLMSLYLLWNRPQGRQHLETGGAAFVNRKGENNIVQTLRLDEQTFDSLMKHLSKKDIEVAKKVGDFLSSEVSEWGNEASMKLYGVRLFNEENYFPISSTNDSLTTNFTNVDNYRTIQNLGITKAVNPNAKNAIKIMDMFDVADTHIQQMSAYSSYAPLNDSMERLINMPNTKAAIKNYMGKEGEKYLYNFLKTVNLNGARDGKWDPVIDKFSGAYKKAAVSFNLSTAAKQPLSIFRASIIIDPKYLVKAKANLVGAGSNYKNSLAEMLNNSGIAKIKEQGYSDIGNPMGLRDTYFDETLKNTNTKKVKYGIDKINEIGMKLAGKADQVTWVRIWEACKLQVQAEAKNTLTQSELLKKTSELFGEVIGKTQVVDSFLDSAPISNSAVFRLVAPFMNEPLKTTSTYILAHENLIDAKGSGDKAAISKAKNYALRTAAAAVASSLILEPLISSVFSIIRDGKDDDLKSFFDKLLENYFGIQTTTDENGNETISVTAKSILTSNFVDGMTSIPIISQIFDIFQNEAQNFDTTIGPIDLWNDTIKSTTKFFEALSNPDSYNQTKTDFALGLDFAANIARLFGIPATSWNRDIRLILQNGARVIPSDLARWNVNKVYYNVANSNARANKNFYDILESAYSKGDKASYYAMLKELKTIQTGEKSYGVKWNVMQNQIEKRGGKIEVGSPMWCVSVQAEFNLPSFNMKMKTESILANVYKDLESAGYDRTECEKVIYKSPTSAPSVTINGEEKTMTASQYAVYVERVGYAAYDLIQALDSTSYWNNLNADQQQYAIEKAYSYVKEYFKKQTFDDYEISAKWMSELAAKRAGNQSIAKEIVSRAKTYKKQNSKITH